MSEKKIKLLLNEVFKERHIDFSEYRESLLERRINVRLRATKKSSHDEYVTYLSGNREEMDLLLDALTINTTQFFRDPRVFESIRKKILPIIFNRATSDERRATINIWSCGCSGGEETVTLLILIAEYLNDRLDRYDIRIHGTDIDKWSIENALDGVYEEYKFKDMPANLREKYFLDMGNRRHWRREWLNRHLAFREHDIVRRKPLMNMDLILCRNVFIYFKRNLQKLCLEKFARSLNEGGFLVLGLTESLWGESAVNYEEFDRENRIFRKK